MKQIHMPRVNARYWTAITLASIFGTNLGDFYAHEAGLGIVKGLIVLAVLAAIVFAAEHFIEAGRELFYWTVIIIIRTGATNIADYLAFRVRVPPLPLTLGLAAIIAVCAAIATLRARGHGENTLPRTDAIYWTAMLGAGVFGTVLGDICSKHFGQGVSSIALGILLGIVLLAGRGAAASIIPLYWLTVSVARTAGTAMGDWFAENKILNIGLPIATLITGITFVLVLVLWKTRPKAA